MRRATPEPGSERSALHLVTVGLTHEARAGPGRSLCLDLLVALNDELLAQGVVARDTGGGTDAVHLE